MKRKQIGMLIFLAVIVILLFVTANTSGVITDPENYQCGVYATVFALLAAGHCDRSGTHHERGIYVPFSRDHHWGTVIFQF